MRLPEHEISTSTKTLPQWETRASAEDSASSPELPWAQKKDSTTSQALARIPPIRLPSPFRDRSSSALRRWFGLVPLRREEKASCCFELETRPEARLHRPRVTPVRVPNSFSGQNCVLCDFSGKRFVEVSDRLVGQRRITSGRKTGSYSAEDIDVISLERTRSLCSAYDNTIVLHTPEYLLCMNL